jgi:hypothetical protein
MAIQNSVFEFVAIKSPLADISDDVSVAEILDSSPNFSSVGHVVFLDGFRYGVPAADKFLRGSTSWWLASKRRRSPMAEKRRLAITSSLGAHKSILHGPEGPCEAEFYDDSWLESELVAACSNTEFLESASPYLDAPNIL